ncbi:BaiN/RdsA family NAD(P)/FAD-dependent oxidoreductase [[Clostridium] colinum]|uniref:NAD(P)/FAD-dependent oxidoreductase n=1 Tax=[Clostridium] colinum TaxID=36835 RepID=UPI0020244613|nr:NAD(P)/FAD-dependent oxidoreductase [[Clostridium] colinum]
MKNTIVIGGGPAGMIASGFAAKNSNVILFEKNKKLGRKLFITGKGRCNLTNACDVEELIQNTIGNPYFLYSAFYTFDSYATMNFFEELGVKVKVERGNRVFPVSEKSSDIVKALTRFMENNKVDIRLNSKVEDLILKDNKIVKAIVNGEEIDVENVIIATGGLSYPVTGSDGDGYKFAKKMGHKVTKLYPSLVPLKMKEKWCQDLQGLSLKNVELHIFVDNKNVYQNFGEMMFTHFGITGPLVLKASRSLVGKYNSKITGYIDLKPALSEKELDNRILRDFEKFINKDFKNSLDELLPQKIIPIIIKLSNIDENKKVNSITKNERKTLCNIIKKLPITIIGDNGYNEAVVTAGGICVDEIDPSTMKSKIIDNLYFAGEVIDVDSYTGGFNLQIAFATGYLAGNNINS